MFWFVSISLSRCCVITLENNTPKNSHHAFLSLLHAYITSFKTKQKHKTTSMELSSATLTLHAITSTTFGGYVLPISSNDWDEETATWEDYVQDDFGDKNKIKNDALKLLPSEDQPSVAQFGNVVEGTNVTTDMTIQVLKTLCCIEGKTMALRIVTDSSDGVIYAAKEHLSGYGPVLEMEFILKTNVTEVDDEPALVPASNEVDVLDVVPTTGPSTVPTASPMEFEPAVVRPFKDEGVGEKTPINATGEFIWLSLYFVFDT